jgi:cell filamentation protein
VNISKGNTPFAFASALVPAASELFTRLTNEKNLQGLGHAVFVSRAAHYLSEINALHPFREGNGRAQRAFLAQLAREAGWTIDWHPISEEQNIRASVEAFGGKENAFADLLGPITTPSTIPLRVVPPPTS